MEVRLENLAYWIIQHLSSPVLIGLMEFCCIMCCLHRVYEVYDYREGFVSLPACFICGTTEHISVTYGVGDCVLKLSLIVKSLFMSVQYNPQFYVKLKTDAIYFLKNYSA